jgi:hypothetical protein
MQKISLNRNSIGGTSNFKKAPVCPPATQMSDVNFEKRKGLTEFE